MRPRSLLDETGSDTRVLHDGGRAVLLALAFNAAGVPTAVGGGLMSSTAGATWVSPDGEAHDVRVQLQAALGGDGITALTQWASNVRVWYRIRSWVKGAPFASPFLPLNGGPPTVWPCHGDRVEIVFWGVTTDNSGPNAPQNAAVTISCSVGEGDGQMQPVTEFGHWFGPFGSESTSLSNQACNVYRVRVQADQWSPALTPAPGNQQPAIYQGLTAVAQNLVTLSGAVAHSDLPGIAIGIQTGGALGTAKFNWMILPGADFSDVPMHLWALNNWPTGSVVATTAATVALGNTGLTANFANNTFTAQDIYLFPAQVGWPMLFDAVAQPGNGAAPIAVGDPLIPGQRSIDWQFPQPLRTLTGLWGRISGSPLNYQPLAAAPARVVWHPLLSAGF